MQKHCIHDFMKTILVSEGKVRRRGGRVEIEKLAIFWAALSSREPLSLEHANRGKEAGKTCSTKTRSQNSFSLGENLPDPG